MCDTTSEISSLYSCAGPQSPTVLEFLQLQVTWPFMRKNRLVIWRQQLPFDWCRWCCLWRMQEACRRAQTYWIVYFYHVTWLTSAIIAAVYSFPETNQKFFSWIYCKTLLLATIFMYSYILRVAHAQRIRIVAMLHRDNEDRFSKQTPDCVRR